MRQIVSLQSVGLTDLADVGGEVASLGELQRELAPKGVRLPDGFAIGTEGFRLHLRRARLLARASELDRLDIADRAALAELGSNIRERIRAEPLPPELDARIAEAYRQLGKRCSEEDTDVALRESPTDHDPLRAPRSARPYTVLNVRGREALMQAVRDCMAAPFSEGAILERVERGTPHGEVATGVVVQKMVRSDLACAGTLFTIDTESGFRDVVIVHAAWGLGESVARDRVTADAFWVHKPGLDRGFQAIIRRDLGAKPVRLVYAPSRASGVREEEVPEELRHRFVLSDDEALLLARWGVRVEQHVSSRAGASTPVCLEWAKDGRSGLLYLVSARAVPVADTELPPLPAATPRVPVLLEITDPNGAFSLGRLPSAGVGRLRTESLLATTLGIHPTSLLESERVTEEDASRLFVEALASGIARIGAAFYPRPVIALLSDFGSSLGLSRSCQAVRRVRDEMGLGNVKAMVSLREDAASTRAALSELERNGLVRGDHDFELYLACTPADEALARELGDAVDGYALSLADGGQIAAAGRFVESAHGQRRKLGLLIGDPCQQQEVGAVLERVQPDWVSVTPALFSAALSALQPGPSP